MKLSLLLYILKRLILKKARRDQDFQALISKRNFVILITTKDGKHSRYFRFHNGELISRKGTYENPDVSLIWDDPTTAFKIMKSGDRSLQQEAIAEGKLKIVGNIHDSLFFSQIAKNLRYF